MRYRATINGKTVEAEAKSILTSHLHRHTWIPVVSAGDAELRMENEFWRTRAEADKRCGEWLESLGFQRIEE
jgi:plasmid stability protein